MARRLIAADLKRFLVSVVGVGAAVGLVILLQAMWSGQLVQITAYEDGVEADLFVAQPGTETLLGDMSLVPLAAAPVIGRLPMVRRADPVYFNTTVSELHGSKEFVFVVGSSPEGLGGPWAIKAGRPARLSGEAVIDSILAEEHGLLLGDSFEMKGYRLTVVGLSAESRSWMAAFIFVTNETASLLNGNRDAASYILIDTNEPERAAAAIEETTGLVALDPSSLAANDRRVLAGILEPPVRLMVLIAFGAGTLVIALTVYSGLVDRFREYGIVKAIGAGRLRVLGIVLGQTLMLAVVGSMVGFLMYLGSAWLVRRLRPQFWFALELRHFLAVITGALLMAAIAAIIPVRQMSRLEPASVYRGSW